MHEPDYIDPIFAAIIISVLWTEMIIWWIREKRKK